MASDSQVEAVTCRVEVGESSADADAIAVIQGSGADTSGWDSTEMGLPLSPTDFRWQFCRHGGRSRLIHAIRVAKLGIPPRQSLSEPARTLGRAPMCKGLWHDVALSTPLDAIITECTGSA
jgi:hypothetical protein